MKTVDLEALKQRLEVARNGDHEQQKTFLASINYHENCIVINEMIDSDLQWIAPLALELFTPAVDVLVSGMTNKYRHWEEDFLDEDTGETVTVLRSESIEGETVFTPDDAIIDQIGFKQAQHLQQLITNGSMVILTGLLLLISKSLFI